MLGLTGLVVLSSYLTLATAGSVNVKPVTPSIPIPKSKQLDWAQYSPYFPITEYKAPPLGCKVNQVNILQRHGARFPTSGATKGIVAALGKIQNVTKYTNSKLNFLKTFKYDLGADDLIQFGADQSFDAGQEAFERYYYLLDSSNIPFVRSDVSNRVVNSAKNWTAGFAAASHNAFKPTLNVIVGTGKNDSLDDNGCPAAGSSDPQTNAWLATFAPPITKKLNAGAPGANLTDTDTFNLISLCAFVTLSHLKKSDFCTLFESLPGSLTGFAYDGDLNKFYGTGYGQPLGPVQGVGYVNELLARLTNSPVKDKTQTNHTEDSSSTTFPLGRTIYADFSHDDEISAIISAIGLFRQPKPLDPTKPNPNRTWRASTIVPFSGRFVFERLTCSKTGNKGEQLMIRVLAQNEVQDLDFCGGDKHGLCTLDSFVKTQSFATSNGNGDWEKCFANTTST